jgi:hypothetical protein
MGISVGKFYDRNTAEFLNATSITNITQQQAVNTLVLELKAYGVWDKMKAIYPFIGGTANTHKYNLKDPRDLDEAFRLNFSGSWTHSSTGALPAGAITSYANTYLVPSSSLIDNNTHLSYYSRTDYTTYGSQTDIGTRGVYPNMFNLRINSFGLLLADAYADGSPGRVTVNPSPVTTGLFLGSRTSLTNLSVYKNGVNLGTMSTSNTTTLTTLPYPVYIAGQNSGGTNSIEAGAKECAFATIGDGLTSTDAMNFYNIVQKFQTTLGRQV